MGSKKSVLVVDDDDDVIAQLTLLFETDGFAVRSAGGRAEGEEALLDGRPDLCVFDLMMEEMDGGFVLADAAKRMYPGVPVILLTAVASVTGMDLRPRSAAGGAWVKADAILDKPIRPEQMRAEVRKVLPA
jgi:CheY-like chemotaxis protein